MTSKHLDPKEYCARCSRRYGFDEESCSDCGFDPIGEDSDEQEEAETDFSIWQNETSDHDL